MGLLGAFRGGRSNVQKAETIGVAPKAEKIDYDKAVSTIEKGGKNVNALIDSYEKYSYEDKRVFKTPVNFVVGIAKILLSELQKKDKVIEEMKQTVAEKDVLLEEMLRRLEVVEKQLRIEPEKSRKDHGHVERF